MSAAPLVLAAVLLAAPQDADRDAVRGTYRVRALLRIERLPLAGPLELRGDVVIRPSGAGPGLSVRLASRGHACVLAGWVGQDGGLELRPGQRCTVVLEDPGATGSVEALLVEGRGRVDAAGGITLALRVDLTGGVRLGSGGLSGLALEAEVPVSGPARVEAEGSRDNSRAAEVAP